ncbi:MAG: hypothetical protein ABGX78_11670 [Microbacterium sp.]|uniref:hypothetical protein n=1 Tax=Microbacterium TaxID=33882 RepID=UPI001D17362D|nr:MULTISPECIES: hypothetical protein [Microbacterium]MCC4266414.1 hypothetical protein [Microbacterium schleiferi]MEC8762245.1 hypothetical protein [Actinomycetota bacterium]
MEIVVGVRLIPEKLRQKLQAIDPVDCVAEVLDASRQIKYDHECGVNLLWGVGAQTGTFGFESCGQVLELRSQSFTLSPSARLCQTWKITRRLGWPRHNLRRPERKERFALNRHPAA